MDQTAERAVQASTPDDPRKVSLIGIGDNSTYKSSAAASRAIAPFKREFISECLRIVAIKAAHAADNFDLGDDLTAERDIRLAVSHLREAAKAFRELEALTSEAGQ